MSDVLPIVWQRLVDEHGRTCARCSATGEQVEHAIETLRSVLAPLGLEPRLERRAITVDQFEAAPLESNRILVDGRPLESWIEAEEGHSPCCEPCGDAECRTTQCGGTTYEVVPGDLIVRAALVAAAHRLIPH